MDRSRIWLSGVAVACLVLLAVALIAQHEYGLEPCAWCVIQRACYLLVAVAALGAALLTPPARSLGMGGAMIAAAGGLVAAGYQHWVAAPAGACGVTLADRLIMKSGLYEWAPWFFMPGATCEQADQPLLGVPFSLWSAAAFVFILLALLRSIQLLAAQRSLGRP